MENKKTVKVSPLKTVSPHGLIFIFPLLALGSAILLSAIFLAVTRFLRYIAII